MDGFLGDLSARSADASVSSTLPPLASLVNSVVVHCQPAGAVDALVSSAATDSASASSAMAVANPAGGIGLGAGAGAGVAPLPTSSALGVQIIALRWLKRLVELGGRSLLPLLSGILAALLPCFALQSPTAAALPHPLPLSPTAGLSLLGGRESPSSITTGCLLGFLYNSLVLVYDCMTGLYSFVSQYLCI